MFFPLLLLLLDADARRPTTQPFVIRPFEGFNRYIEYSSPRRINRKSRYAIVRKVPSKFRVCSPRSLRRSRKAFHLAGISLQLLLFWSAIRDKKAMLSEISGTNIMVAMCLAVALATFYGPRYLCKHKTRDEFAIGMQASSSEVRAGQFWRLATAAMIHSTFEHLFFNMLSLFGWGSRLRGYLHNVFKILRGEWRSLDLFGVYSTSAILGNLLHITWTKVPAIGASGGIYGLKGYVLMHNWLRNRTDAVQSELQYLLVEVMAEWVMPGVSRIAVFAHLGGFLTGAIMRYCRTSLSGNWRRQFPLLAWVALVCFLGFGQPHFTFLPEEVSSIAGLKLNKFSPELREDLHRHRFNILWGALSLFNLGRLMLS